MRTARGEGRPRAQRKRGEWPGDDSRLSEQLPSRRPPEAESQRPSGAGRRERASASPPFLRFPPRCAQRKPVSPQAPVRGTAPGSDRSPFLMASSFLASIPRAPRRDTWSWGPAAPDFPGATGRRLLRLRAHHSLAGRCGCLPWGAFPKKEVLAVKKKSSESSRLL